MTADQAIRLVSVLVWPAVVLFALVRFGGPIGGFLKELRRITVNAVGVGVTAERRQVQAAVALGAAQASRQPAAIPPPLGSADGAGYGIQQAVDVRSLADALPSGREQRRLQGSRVLWVDDRPENNHYERLFLEALGIHVDISTSTDDALAKIQHQPYDLVISDMRRPPDERAGYTLLDELRRRGDSTPYLIYSSSRDPRDQQEARRRGAIGSADMAQELLTMATAAITARR